MFQVSLLFKQKFVLLLIDLSMACTLGKLTQNKR